MVPETADTDEAGRYPEYWEADVILRDGATAQLRPISPEDRDALLAFHQSQSENSIYLRFFSVNETLTRTVTRDVELGGQQLGPGDHLMISWLSANRDPKVFDCPDEVVLDREANPHLAFGVGPHRCIGSHMARTLFQVLLREVLTRIPDYAVDREATRFYQGNPELNGVVRMPARFTPGARTGPDQPPF